MKRDSVDKGNDFNFARRKRSDSEFPLDMELSNYNSDIRGLENDDDIGNSQNPNDYGESSRCSVY